MATTTPNYHLRKPTANDNVNVVTDISANMDLLDAHAHSGTSVASSAAGEVTAVTVQGAIENLAGGANVSNARLKDWTSAEAYEATAITRDANDVVTSATVVWPDGSAGTFTATTINSTWLAIDAFTVTHTASSKTVTQTAVTRNANGAVTTKPALTVA